MAALTASSLLLSCQNDETVSQSEQITEDEALLDEMSTFTDIIVETNIGSDQESEQALKASAITYPVVEVTFPSYPLLWPRQVSVDFGTENIDYVVGNPNAANPLTVKVRGKLLIEQSGPLFATGTERTVEYNGFYINNYKLEGETQFVNNGLNDGSNYEFSWIASLKATATSGRWVSRSVSKVREMVSGAGTPLNVWDDAFLVNGTAVGLNSSGWAYNHLLNDVLVKRICRFPVSGTVEVENSLASFVIDYGNGECDNVASIIKSDGSTVTVRLDRY